MTYYIMYEDDSDYEMTVVPFEESGDVTRFIEEKINKHAYRLDAFSVVQGTKLNLRAVKAPTKVLLTN